MGIEEINISYGHKLILMLINKIFVNFLVQFFVQLIIYMVLIFGYINHLFCFMKYQFYFSILTFFFNFSKKLNIKYYVEFKFSFFFQFQCPIADRIFLRSSFWILFFFLLLLMPEKDYRNCNQPGLRNIRNTLHSLNSDILFR